MKIDTPRSLCLLATAVFTLGVGRLEAQCLPPPMDQWFPDPGTQVEFGLEVAISGDWAVVGACLEDLTSPFREDAGAAYVYRRTASVWMFHSKLTASDAAAFDQFGVDVDIDGATIVVGARQHNHAASYWLNAGAAYVFEFDGVNNWSQSTELLNSDGTPSVGEFAATVGISGDTIVVGSQFDDALCADCGGTYVYVEPALGWSASPLLFETAKLVSSFPSNGLQFGDEVAIDGETIIVGAWRDDTGGVLDSGAVYVFEKLASGWATGTTSSARIVLDAPQSDSEFGVRLDVQEDSTADLVAITARSYSLIADHSGAAFAVDEPMGGWSGEITVSANLLSSQITAFDNYGLGISIDGNRIVVGSPQDDPPGHEDIGRAFVFERQSGKWVDTYWLQADLHDSTGTYAAYMGGGVAIEGTTVLVGAHLDDNPAGPDAGTVLVYDLTPCHVQLYCFCDGGAPCMNTDSSAGCSNSSGAGTLLVDYGTTSVAGNDLMLSATGLPINQFGIMFMGGAAAEHSFGDGHICVAAGGIGIFRYLPPQNSGPLGQIVEGPIVSRSQSFAPAGRIGVGDTWYFQCWYRDPMGPCGFGFNFSNALAATFIP